MKKHRGVRPPLKAIFTGTVMAYRPQAKDMKNRDHFSQEWERFLGDMFQAVGAVGFDVNVSVLAKYLLAGGPIS